MILYTKNPKDTTRKLLELIKEPLVKLQDTKLKYKNQLHFYGLTAKDREIKDIILSTIISRRIKYLGINLPKDLLQKL